MLFTEEGNRVTHKQGSRYTFTETPSEGRGRSVQIEGEGRNTVFVDITPTCLLVRYRDERGGWYIQPYGFFDYYPFAADVTSGLILGWKPPEGRRGWPGVRGWVHRQTGRAISKRLHAHYKSCLRDIDPTVLALQRNVFAATFSAPALMFREELYREGHLVNDLIQYRAAAVALANLERFRDLLRSRVHLEAEQKILRSMERKNLEKLAEAMEVKLSIHVLPRGHYRRDPLGIDEALEMMENWRGLFSPTGKSYRSLDRTLMNLPGGVPPGLVPYLSLVRLERPVLSRSELVVLALYEKWCLQHGSPRRNASVFHRASHDRIARATRLVAQHTRNPLSSRRANDLRFIVRFLMDYPEEHEGNIVGLAEKSIRWHRHQQEQETERILERLGRDRLAEAPPIPVPQEPDVRFLPSVEEVCREGMQMNNCVGTYAGRAAGGQCYLFHISHAGEEATVEVSRAGRVVQAAGPRNEINAASRWGKRVLNRWGKKFPEEHKTTAPTFINEELYDDIPF